jgi:PAS domain S-box-containing protein
MAGRKSKGTPTADPEVPLQAAGGAAPQPDAGGVVRPGCCLQDILQQVVDDARRLLEVDVAIIYVAERNEDTPNWSYDSGLTARAREESQREQFDLYQGISGLAIQTGKVAITEDYLNDDRFLTPERRRLNAEHLGTTSVVAVPMFGEAGPLGVICVFDRRHRHFTEFELALLRSLAAHSALAIENARLARILAAAEARYRFLVERSPDVVWSTDAEDRFTFVNATSRRLLGWTPEELIGLDSEMVHHPSTDEELHRRLDAHRKHPEGELLYRCNLRHRDGRAIPVELHMSGIYADGRWVGAHGSVRDTSEHERLERELLAREAELAAGHERALLAQELHDSVTQTLFAMTLTSRVAEKLLETDPSAAAEKLVQCREAAQDALTEMRALIYEMRPGSLAEDGLVGALRKHVASVESRTGLPIVVEADEIENLGRGLEEALYRICQEALHNVVKHAGAHRAHVEIRRDNQCICATISDDGAGFDPAAVADSRSGHLGLDGMRTRAERFRGSLEIESAPGGGTRVRARLPVDGAGGGTGGGAGEAAP